jgi:Flp pilus assembly protein TadG
MAHMKKMFSMISKNSEKGQSIVLIALVFVGLLAFIGLTVDMGILFISYGNLRRAVDSAALAAATQMRSNYTAAQLNDSAQQFLRLNNVIDGTASIQTCDDVPGDPQLCGSLNRKLVRVIASAPVEFSFLPVIGFYNTTITANAIGEAASLDVVLVIDTSESMSEQPPVGHPEYRDPGVCNSADLGGVPGECHPFEEVKVAAGNFAAWVLDKPAAKEEDRLAIVTFSDAWEPHNVATGRGTGIVSVGGDTWLNDQAVAINAIHNLNVYQPAVCPIDWITNGSAGICSQYDGGGNFQQIVAPWRQPDNVNAIFDAAHIGDAAFNGERSTSQTTNIGGGLNWAAFQLSQDMHPDALWLVVLLTDGAANATDVDPAAALRIQQGIAATGWLPNVDLPAGFCPEFGALTNPPCRDTDVTTRHDLGDALYDAEDFARDRADLVSCPSKVADSNCHNDNTGQAAIMFSIGLGDAVFSHTNEVGGRPYGDTLLRYIAAVGDDNDPTTDPCSAVAVPGVPTSYNCGNYFFTTTGSGLDQVFNEIASRVYTRLTR